MLVRRRLAFLARPLGLAITLTAHAGDFYQQHKLVSDGAVAADHADANLVSGRGVAFNPFGPVWVAHNYSGTSTLYDGAGNPQPPAQPLVVQIPSPTAATGGTPTGIVFNGSAGFVIAGGAASGSAKFIFATEDGVISAWAPNGDLHHALKIIDGSPHAAVYEGLALSAGGSGSLLYAADFRNGRIDVFDANFMPVDVGGFADPTIPLGYAPFGLQAIGGDIFVSYARQADARHDDVKGAGFGFINVFDPNGHLIRRVVSRGRLNAPWGMTVAPAGFGRFAGRLLVGNFGDGTINAYDLGSGAFVGRLKGPDHRPIQIDGLWGLAFGNGFAAQPVDTLFFAAGPFVEAHGLYGRIDLAPGDDRDKDGD